MAAGAAALLMVLGGWLLYRRGVVKGRIMSGATQLQQLQQQPQQKRAEEPTGQGNITAVATAAEWSSHHHQYQQPYHSYNYDAESRPCEIQPTPPAPRELE